MSRERFTIEKARGRSSSRPHGHEGAPRKKLLKPKRRRKAAEHLVQALGLRKARASRITGMARSGHFYK